MTEEKRFAELRGWYDWYLQCKTIGRINAAIISMFDAEDLRFMFEYVAHLKAEAERREREAREQNVRLWRMLHWWIARGAENERAMFNQTFAEVTTVTAGPFGKEE